MSQAEELEKTLINVRQILDREGVPDELGHFSGMRRGNPSGLGKPGTGRPWK